MILAVLPTSDLLEYPSCYFSKRLSGVARILYGEEATPERIDSALDGSEMFLGVGHGLDCVYTVQDRRPYLAVRGESEWCTRNLRLGRMAGRLVYLVSCYTGRRLGEALVERGAPAFLGFTDEYLFYIGDPPCSKPSTTIFFEAELAAIATLLAGGSVGEAERAREEAYRRGVEAWDHLEYSMYPESPLVSRLLEYDSTILTAMGDLDYRLPRTYSLVEAKSGEAGLEALALAALLLWGLR